MLKNLRDRLSEKDKGLFKLVVWACLLVWMVFFLIFSVVTARYGKGVILSTVSGKWGEFLSWVFAIWAVFTSLLIIYYVTRFATRKLRRKALHEDRMYEKDFLEEEDETK